MDVFSSLFIRIIPLYFIIFLGYVAGRFLRVNKEPVASLLIYIISPVVIFNSVLTTKISLNVLSLAALFFFLCCFISFVSYVVAKKIWKDSTKNILAFIAGTANTGYFGLPVAIALFGPDIAGLVVIFILGFVLYENSLGFFITARGHHTVDECFVRISRLPAIYAFVLGVALNLFRAKLSASWFDFADLFRGAYSVLGMMLIGMGLAGVSKFRFDFKFVGFALVMKFIFWPLTTLAIVYADTTYFHFFDARIYKVMILMSIVPLAANSVAYATEFKTYPEKTAVAVLISTIVALFLIPWVAAWFWVR